MSIFDRFTSQKGKQTAAKPKTGKISADEAQQKTFAEVPSGKEKEAPVAEKKAAPAKGKKEAGKAMVAKESTDRADRILVRPVVTEKSTMGQALGQYTFMVSDRANKVDVRQAVFHVYGVMPVSVNITSLPGKWVRYGRSTGRTVARKKAVVTLPAGKKIDISS